MCSSKSIGQCTIIWCLSLMPLLMYPAGREVQCISLGQNDHLPPNFVYESDEGFCKFAHMTRLALAVAVD